MTNPVCLNINDNTLLCAETEVKGHLEKLGTIGAEREVRSFDLSLYLMDTTTGVKAEVKKHSLYTSFWPIKSISLSCPDNTIEKVDNEYHIKVGSCTEEIATKESTTTTDQHKL